VQKSFTHLDEKRVELVFEMPLAEVLFVFYDKLKSTSRGYASFDYEVIDYRPRISRNSTFSSTENRSTRFPCSCTGKAPMTARGRFARGFRGTSRVNSKSGYPGSYRGQIIARETVNPVRKDVLAKCYGGDISRRGNCLKSRRKAKKLHEDW